MTTVPQITARAGLTTRTFFRHFADKREVLFGREREIPELAGRMIAEADPALTPLEVVAAGLDVVAAVQFSGDIEIYRTRKSVIDSDAGLKERELRKSALLTDAIASGFRERGVDDLTATLVAHVTATVFTIAIGRWLEPGDDLPLPFLLHQTLDALRSLMAPA